MPRVPSQVNSFPGPLYIHNWDIPVATMALKTPNCRIYLSYKPRGLDVYGAGGSAYISDGGY